MASFSDIMKGVIYSKGRGCFITPDDFGAKVSSASLRTELVNFNNSRLLIHVARGLYFFPHIGKDGKQVRPTLYDIMKHIEVATKGMVFPSEETAYHLLGLTEERPTPMLFYTTGTPKTLNLNSGPELVFKKASKRNRIPQFQSIKVRTLFMVYSAMEESRITKKMIAAMNRYCSEFTEEDFADDYESLPLWMKENLKFPVLKKNVEEAEEE